MAHRGGGVPHTAGMGQEKWWTLIQEVAPASIASKRMRTLETTIPTAVAALVPESNLYARLYHFEKHVDATLESKADRITSALEEGTIDHDEDPIASVFYRLRVYMKLVADATGPSAASGGGGARLHIYGSVERVDPAVVPSTAGVLEANRVGSAPADTDPDARCLSEYFKQITVETPPAVGRPDAPTHGVAEATASAYPSGMRARWVGEQYSGLPSNCFRVGCGELRSLRGTSLSVKFELKDQPLEFCVPDNLARAIGLSVGTKATVIAALWQHIKAKGLQSPNEPSMVELGPRSALKPIFGEGKKSFLALVNDLTEVLVPAKPFEVSYDVPPGADDELPIKALDIRVRTPARYRRKETETLLSKLKTPPEVATLNNDIKHLIEDINEKKRRRDFFLGFSQSPVDFISSLVASQQRDLKTMKKYQTSCPSSYTRRSHIFRDAWIHDAAVRYLHQRIASNQQAQAPGGREGGEGQAGRAPP